MPLSQVSARVTPLLNDLMQLAPVTCGACFEDMSQKVETLRPRLRQVLLLLLAGASEKEMAVALDISPHTVHIHIKGVYRCFGSATRAELMCSIYQFLLRGLLFHPNRSLGPPDDVSAAAPVVLPMLGAGIGIAGGHQLNRGRQRRSKRLKLAAAMPKRARPIAAIA
jgi:DNA-binding CsgD family transcriptional regulator